MKLYKLILLISTFICHSIFANEIIDENEFIDKYVSVVTNKITGVQFEIISKLEIKFETSNGKEHISYLDNAYIDYKTDPSNIDNILDLYANSLVESLNMNEKSYGKERIFPVIKDHAYIEQVGALLKKKNNNDKFPFLYEKLNDVLYVLYAFDTPKSIKFLTDDDIVELGVSSNELRNLSKANLKKSIPSIQIDGDPTRISILVADGTYEASFLLFDNLWTKKQFPVQGEIVVYVPSRDLVLITGSKDLESLAKVQNIVYNSNNEWSHIVAEVGFIRTGGKWEVYKP